MLHQLYGRKSEKNILDDDFDQMSLFGSLIEDNAEFQAEGDTGNAGDIGDIDDIDDSVDTITIPEHTRKKGRKPLPGISHVWKSFMICPKRRRRASAVVK